MPRAKSHGRTEVLIRCLTLMRAIEGRRHCPPVGQLAAQLEVSQRTICRYLDALSAAGVAVPPTFSEWRDEERGAA